MYITRNAVTVERVRPALNSQAARSDATRVSSRLDLFRDSDSGGDLGLSGLRRSLPIHSNRDLFAVHTVVERRLARLNTLNLIV